MQAVPIYQNVAVSGSLRGAKCLSVTHIIRDCQQVRRVALSVATSTHHLPHHHHAEARPVPHLTPCPERDSNPHGNYFPRDFKSLASTDFATRASVPKIPQHNKFHKLDPCIPIFRHHALADGNPDLYVRVSDW